MPILDLTFEEFAVLEHLRWKLLTGTGVRDSISEKFSEVIDGLPSEKQEQIMEVRQDGLANRYGYPNADQIISSLDISARNKLFEDLFKSRNDDEPS